MLSRTSSATGKLSHAQGVKRQYPTSASEYELLDEVGHGISAKVFRALCKPLNEIVAVKAIELEGVNNNLEEIMREAKTMRLASHKDILSLHCSFVTGQSLWMVMPYVAGGSCLSIMKWAYRDGLEENVIASIMCEVLRAIDYLHKNKYIHRDVKAGNILIDLNGEVKLGDFGVAATMQRSGSWGGSSNVRQTFVGTPCWMAPEVMEQAKGYDWHADIWSFGITMLELAHGHAPFAKYPPMKVLLMTLQNEPPKLEESYGKRHFSKAMREVVTLCLQKEPERRPMASKLLEHRFFKNAHHDKEFLVKHLLRGLPSLVERVISLSNTASGQKQTKHAMQADLEIKSQDQYKKGVSSWEFDVEAIKDQARAIQQDHPARDESHSEPQLASPAAAPATSEGGSAGTAPNDIKDQGRAKRDVVTLEVAPPGGETIRLPPKAPTAHKGRFNIYLDDDDSLLNSPPKTPNSFLKDPPKAMPSPTAKASSVPGDIAANGSNGGAAGATGGQESASLVRKTSAISVDTLEIKAASAAVADEIGESGGKVKKEQRGRFWVIGQPTESGNTATDTSSATSPIESSGAGGGNGDAPGDASDVGRMEVTSPPHDGSPSVGPQDPQQQQKGAAGQHASQQALATCIEGLLSNMSVQYENLQTLMSSLTPASGNLTAGKRIASAQSLPTLRGSDAVPPSKLDDHKVNKCLDDFNGMIRALVEENDKLKKRNLTLERELTKCQNKLLELQEKRAEEEKEEKMKRIERESSEVISDRDHARHMAASKTKT